MEAAIYVQPVCCGDNSITCTLEDLDNCFPWCMGVVRGGLLAQNITMYKASMMMMMSFICSFRNKKEVGGTRYPTDRCMHKKQVWLTVWLAQTIVVACDVMLAIAKEDVSGNADCKTCLVVTML